MVNTRRTVRKDTETAKDDVGTACSSIQQHKIEDERREQSESKMAATDAYSDNAQIKSGSRSKSSSVIARKKKLELEAAEAKARIQMDLIQKRLDADIAELEYSSRSGNSEKCSKVDVEQWLNHSQMELEAQALPPYGNQPGDLEQQPPPPPGLPAAGPDGTTDTVQMLASALKDLAAITTTNGPNAQMLSRISTPRELPAFSGEPMEWLQFKQAYNDSTKICHFSDQENLWRLRKCLHGPAKEAVTALLIGATSPAIVMSALELQFGNPDVIISRIMYDIKKIHPLSQEYHKDIVSFSIKVQNYVAAVRAIGQDEYLKGTHIMANILSKLPTVLISRWADYSYTLIDDKDKPRLVLLSEFLNSEAIKISKTSLSLVSYNPADCRRKQSDHHAAHRAHAVLVQHDRNSDDKCRFCRLSNHQLTDCKKFKKALRKDRWQFVKRNGICFKCLVSRHQREFCSAPVCDAENCGQSHHKLLHINYTAKDFSQGNSATRTNEQLVPVQSDAPCSETVTHVKTNSTQVLLKTVPVYVHGPNGMLSAVALLDDGSTVSIISDNLVKQLGISGRKHTLRVRGAWNDSDVTCQSELLDVCISNTHGDTFTMQARGVKELNLPAQYVPLDELICSDSLENTKHLLCTGECKPEILIGQDNYNLLLPLEVCRGKLTGSYISRTPLGWCVHGRLGRADARHVDTSPTDAAHHSTMFITTENDQEEQLENHMSYDLLEEVRRSFSMEAMGVSGNPRQNSENVRAIDHLEKTSSLKDGRWYVGLPWNDVNCTMPESCNNAFRRLLNVEKKCKANSCYAERYAERIEHLLKNDYARELQDTKVTPKTWYLPHFGVDNPNKNKLRLVFDAAAKCNGLSLNDYLLTGPDLLMSLYGIMLRFRQHEVAVTGDIRDMFLRIKIIPEDQNALRFLWRSNEGSEASDTKTYAMTSLIFGANCSPFVAQFIKNKNAKQYESSHPDAVNAICAQHYMDDYIDSFTDSATAIQLIEDITRIHKQGGFEIRNWTSNCEAVTNSVPKETLSPDAVRFKVGQQITGARTLGVIWYPKEDELAFDITFKRIPENIINGLKRPTKREMLKLIMSIFDVYGFLAPFTIKAKIMLQQMWKTNLDWDDDVPDSIYKKWLDWLGLLKSISNIRIPRCYHASVRASETALMAPSSSSERSARTQPPLTACRRGGVEDSDRASAVNEYTNLQLHIFCDASTQAMCAVAYWRWINNAAEIQVAFISSKCRVAPLKHTSVPRLELQAALLASRLADTVIKEHKMVPQEKYYWCDSSTVLYWIRNSARDYKPFIAHRLGEIDELTSVKQWHYVPTKMNVADIATRDTCEINVLQNEWLFGPEFLYLEKESWPKDLPNEVYGENVEHVSVINEDYVPDIPDPERFSSWLRLLRATCVVLSFIDKCRKLTGEINGDMMRRAERLLILYSQRESFVEDLQHLKHKKTLEHRSKLLTLSPFIDESGILRVGGRIDAALGIPPETKQPVILDGRNYITMLIIKHYHVKAAHGNRETVVNDLKQKYWIIRVRPTVKKVTSQCMFCKIKKTKPHPPRMGDLPMARVAHHHRPFSFCGVDLFGPMEVAVCRRREKRYGVLFTCMTVRAIHIEIVTNLTTDAFIMSLRRMAARRGWPQHLYSDNGTNLRGADNELKRSIRELDEDALKREASIFGTTWTFSPPASPHWGGAWERLIRTVKTALKVVLKERAPRDEVLSTLMAEVEQLVNSRPLTHVSVEPHTDEALTPNHFLLHSSSNLPTLGVFDESDTYLRKQWRITQRLTDLFWKRWVREVLPEMRPRSKWLREERPLQEGDLVLVVDPDLPRGVWPRGRILKVMPGRDGRVRVVEVKTKSGVMRRSAARVALIPTENEC